MMLKLRNIMCAPIGMIGPHLWQPAFDKGTQDNYDSLTLSEKIGYHLMAWYIVKGKLMTTSEMNFDEFINT